MKHRRKISCKERTPWYKNHSHTPSKPLTTHFTDEESEALREKGSYYDTKARHGMLFVDSQACVISKPLLQPALLPRWGQMGVGGLWEENAHDMLRMWGKWGPRRFHQECHGRGTRLQEHLSIPDDMEITRNGRSSWRNSQTGTGI